MAKLAGYSFDEASGAALDSSGNGRDVTLSGSLTRVTGHTGTGLGASGSVSDSAGPALTGMQTAAYTIMGWVKRTNNLVDGWLMEFKQSGSGDRGLLFTSGNIQSRCKNVAGTAFNVQTAQPTAGTAYHFACTNDGTMLRLYINGSEVGTGTAFSGGVRTNSTSSSFMDGTGAETWLDDARYYDTALDAATITTLMNTPEGAAPAVSGVMSGSLPALTGALTGNAAARGTAAGPIPAMIGSLTGTATVEAAESGLLPALVGAFTGDAEARGAAAGPMPGFVGAFAGSVAVSPSGQFGGFLPALTGQLVAHVAGGPELRDLTLTGRVEPDRWRALTEPDRWRTEVEPS